jgi:fibro-slime domain-containing protein
MIRSQSLVLLSFLVATTAMACGNSKPKGTENTTTPGYHVGNTGGTGGTDVDQALQPNGDLLVKGIIRDFRKTFPDMEPCSNNSAKVCDSKHDEQHPGCESTGQCIVAMTLGADGKPQYAGPAGGTETTTGPANFNAWFHDTSNSMAAQVEMPLSPTGTGTYVYENMNFFPIDGQLFGNESTDGNGVSHNFNFTTEWHLVFTYQPGQTFRFHGDDDLWVFVDGKLVIDLGGIHNGHDATLQLDTLGMAAGTDHLFEIFYCERHVTQSEIEIETTIQFTGSVGTIVN